MFGLINWTKEGKMIMGGVGVLTAVLTLVQLAPVAEPFVPVTHGYYRAMEDADRKDLLAVLDQRKDARDRLFSDFKTEQDKKLLALKVAADDAVRQVATQLDDQGKQLDLVREQGIENQLTALAGQIRFSRANLTDLAIKAESSKDNPPLRDMILRSKADAEAELADLEKAKDRVQCQLNKARGFTVMGC